MQTNGRERHRLIANGEPEIDEVFSHANPNPDRIGCPPHEVLDALARRQLAIGDPAYAHLADCSPCFREFREIQTSAGQRLERARRQFVTAQIAMAAVILLIAALGLAWLVLPHPTPDITSQDSPDITRAELDLRTSTTIRNDVPPPDSISAELPRRLLRLSILLPVGSEPGEYEIQLLDANRNAQIRGDGVAEIRSYVTTIEASLDLRKVRAGGYRLAIRRPGDDWRLFPIRVR